MYYNNDKLYSGTNPNQEIFELTPEEGGTPEDKMHSAITDASLTHHDSIGALNRAMLNEFHSFPNGAIFSFQPNKNHNIAKPSEMDKSDAIDFLSKKGIITEENEDLFTKGDRLATTIEEYEKNFTLRDAPATPKDTARYLGNTKQVFYDDFPEDHPNADTINMFLAMIRNNINNFWKPQGNHASYADYINDMVGNWLCNGQVDNSTAQSMSKIIAKIAGDDLNDSEIRHLIRSELQQLDEEYGQEVAFESLCRSLTTNKAFAFLMDKERTFEERFNKGHEVYWDLRYIGKQLYDFEENEDESIITRICNKQYVWFRYNLMKKKYAPKIIMEGIDINRCYSVDTLENMIGFTEEQSKKILNHLLGYNLRQINVASAHKSEDGSWEKIMSPHKWRVNLHGGVFSNISEVFKISGANARSFTTITERKKLDNLFNIVDDAFRVALKQKNVKKLMKVAPGLIDMQKANEMGLEHKHWKSVWNRYNKLKSNVIKEV